MHSAPFNIFNRLLLWQKFTGLGILCLALVALPTLLYTAEVRDKIKFSEREQQGLAPAQLMLNIIQHSQQHRGLSARFLSDRNPSAIEKINTDIFTKAKELNAAYESLQAQMNNKPNPNISIKNQVAQWQKINSDISKKQLTTEQSFQQHTELIRAQLDTLQTIVDEYQLSLDPESDGYFLISASLMILPDITELLGQMRAHSIYLLAKGNADSTELTLLRSLLLMSNSKLKELESNIQKATTANPNEGGNIFAHYKSTQTQQRKIITLVEKEILNKENFSYTADEAYNTFTLAINSYFSYEHFALNEISTILQNRIQTQQQKMTALLSYIVIITLIVSIICFIFIKNLLRQLGGEPNYALQVVQAITRGDWDHNIKAEHPNSLLNNMKIMQAKLKENERLKNEFISTVSHELRTPLTSINGAIAISISGKMGELPPFIQNLLTMAHKNTQKLSELINDLLDIDKLIAGQLHLDELTQPIGPVIEDAVESMQSYAEKYSIKLTLHIDRKDTLVTLDARRTQQALVNFISNACKFSPAGETVSINVSTNDYKVRVDVIDHGIGIPEEFQPRIFQKFSQADSSDTRAVGGTGLGLAISKALIDRMGGNIGFKSSKGIGTCFYFEFPIASTPKEIT